MPYDDKVVLSWRSYTKKAPPVTIYAATTNQFSTGGKDTYIELAKLPAGTTSYTVDLRKLPTSSFYKFVVVAPHNHLNRWLKR